jgi:hypothetical protein
MRRREFIVGLAGAAAMPVVARGQQPAVPVIGYLGAQSNDDEYKNFTVPFLQGLKETGYVEGQNVAVEYRYAENQFHRLPALAADLVRRRVGEGDCLTPRHTDRDRSEWVIGIALAGDGAAAAAGDARCRVPQPQSAEVDCSR